MAVFKTTIVLVLVFAVLSSTSPCYEAGRSCRHHHRPYFTLFLQYYSPSQDWLITDEWGSMCRHWWLRSAARCDTVRGPSQEWRRPLHDRDMRLAMPVCQAQDQVCLLQAWGQQIRVLLSAMRAIKLEQGLCDTLNKINKLNVCSIIKRWKGYWLYQTLARSHMHGWLSNELFQMNCDMVWLWGCLVSRESLYLIPF
jgi:hypothetical protein